jgi:hypothetical protein
MSEHLDQSKNSRPDGARPGALAPPRSERRRSARWSAYVPVFVYGHPSGRPPFHENAYSAIVSDRGALLVMSAAAPPGERLLLTNRVTQASQECRVVRSGPGDGLSVQVAVEFAGPAPHFWHLTAQPRAAFSLVSEKERKSG